MNPRTVTSLSIGCTALLLVLLALVVTQGWWDYVLLGAAVALLLGGYWMRHRVRTAVYAQAQTRDARRPRP